MTTQLVKAILELLTATVWTIFWAFKVHLSYVSTIHTCASIDAVTVLISLGIVLATQINLCVLLSVYMKSHREQFTETLAQL